MSLRIKKAETLQAVAREFVRTRFDGKHGVMGVLLTGSASLGYVDSLTDIDLEVMATESLWQKARGMCGSEKYRGREVWWEYMTSNEIESQLKDWRDDIDLWVYSKTTILYDPQGKLKRFLSKYKKYPRRIWLEKLFTYFYFATGSAPYDSGKAIQRRDYITAQLYLNQAIEYYTCLIFVLNGSFIPYRKWRLKEFEGLAYKPKDYKETLRKVLTVTDWSKQEFERKQRLITALAGVLQKRLSKAGIADEKLSDPWRYKVFYVPRA